MLVVDTSVWIDYFNGIESPHSDYLHAALDQRPILVGDLILAEILQGIRSDAEFERTRRTLETFNQASMVNPKLAVQSARNFRYLCQKGITIRKTIDSLIATFCIEFDHELLHNDRDFDGYEDHLGLRVLHP